MLQYLTDCLGPGPLRVHLTVHGGSNNYPVILVAADAIGIVVRPEDNANQSSTYPWTSVKGIKLNYD